MSPETYITPNIHNTNIYNTEIYIHTYMLTYITLKYIYTYIYSQLVYTYIYSQLYIRPPLLRRKTREMRLFSSHYTYHHDTIKKERSPANTP